MEPSEYIECKVCAGSGCVDSETGHPSGWTSASASECAACDGMGHWLNPEHVERMKFHLRELLDSQPFLDELENANYHSATDFLEELRDSEW